jgi:membrane-associated phospholipid phosphatase
MIERLLAWIEEAGLHARRWGKRAAPLLARQRRRLQAGPLTWGTLWVALFCALAMAVLDRPLALFLKARVGGDVEGFFRVVTGLGAAELYLVPAVLACLACVAAMLRAPTAEARRRWRALAWKPGYVVLTMAVSGLMSTAIKGTAGRMRPRLLFEDGLYGFAPFSRDWSLNSFPSGHSQAAWAAMTALLFLAPRHAALWLLIAVLVATSRVMLTVHYLSDAVAGSWIGFAAAVLVARLLTARGVVLPPESPPAPRDSSDSAG